MTVLTSQGISASLPAGVEGRIYRRPSSHGAIARSVTHLATFALPPEPADFGGGAVDLMQPTDVFLALLEYGPESATTKLFVGKRMPRALRPQDFSVNRSRSGRAGHSGAQLFFVEGGRPFTLYAVLGSHLRRKSLVQVANRMLSSLRIEARAS